MAEWMLSEGLVHFLATDAHGQKSRRPLMQRAFQRVAELSDWETARELCCHAPADVAQGQTVAAGRRRRTVQRRSLSGWFTWRKAG
jgi:tyrosine-protein phosphatase YwqE